MIYFVCLGPVVLVAGYMLYSAVREVHEAVERERELRKADEAYNRKVDQSWDDFFDDQD